MEVVYEGPRGMFAEFGTALCELAGVDGYTVDGVLAKGWVTDEIVRYVVQFDPEEARSQMEILSAAIQWAAAKSSFIHVSLPDVGAERPDDGADEATDEA